MNIDDKINKIREVIKNNELLNDKDNEILMLS
jgi:hypothetical protein